MGRRRKRRRRRRRRRRRKRKRKRKKKRKRVSLRLFSGTDRVRIYLGAPLEAVLVVPHLGVPFSAPTETIHLE